MTEETPLPLARMVTIHKPSFWIFMACCIILYTCNKFATTENEGNTVTRLVHGNYICAAAFAGLFFNLITGVIKNQKINRVLTVWCYLFEIACLVTLGIVVLLNNK